MKDCYLVIDQGGHSTRVVVYDERGRSLFQHQSHVELHSPKPGWYEQDIAQITRSVEDVFQALEKFLSQTTTIQLVKAALITQRSSLLACHKQSLAPISPLISWQDTRNKSWLNKQIDQGAIVPQQVRQLTGLQPNGHYGASKMRWLLDNDLLIQDTATKQDLVFLPLAAYLAHTICQRRTKPILVDAVTASRTCLVELGELDWSEQLIEQFGLSEDWLPAIVPTEYDYGVISLNEQQIPLTVVGGDQSFLPFAYPLNTTEKNNAVFVNAGTGAFVLARMHANLIPQTVLASYAILPAEDPTHALAEGTVNACATALDWLWQQAGRQLPPEQLQLALDSCHQPPLFHHRLTPLGSPYWLAEGVSDFSSNTATLEAKAVAVIESIIFLLCINLELFQAAQPHTGPIFISGGVSRLDGFCQKLADCSAITVVRCDNTEAASRGVAHFLAICPQSETGPLPSTEFIPDSNPPLQQRYRQFCQWLESQLD